MDTNKKNGFLKGAGSMMAVTMLATCVVAGTMAKYTTSSNTLSAKAQVASWSITANENDISSKDLSLSDFTIYDTNPGTATPDDNVEAGLIVPGTWGYAKVEIKNAGEVDAKISATFTKGSTDLPDVMKVVALSSVPETSAAVTGTTDPVNATLKPNETTNVVIAFVWEIGDPTNDENDTLFGINAASGSAHLELGKLSIIADQVD